MGWLRLGKGRFRSKSYTCVTERSKENRVRLFSMASPKSWEVIGTNWNTKNLLKCNKKTQKTVMGIVHLTRLSSTSPDGEVLILAYSKNEPGQYAVLADLALWSGVELDDLQKSFQILKLLWFCKNRHLFLQNHRSEVASRKCNVGKQGVLCVLLRRVLHMVVMTRGHKRTSTVTKVLLGDVPYYMDMSYFGTAPPWCVCNMDITNTDFKSQKMSVGDCCSVTCI